MTPGFEGAPALVPGRLQGFRRFRLAPDGLYPMVVLGRRWPGAGETAACHSGTFTRHEAPHAGCRCGLYGWYDPADDAQHGWLTGVPAVVAATGRVILGDSGFRAEHARITAVALPWHLRWRPSARRRAAAMLARVYPDVTVYDRRGAMLAAHPREDLAGLGITARPSEARHSIRVLRWSGVALLAYVALLVALPVFVPGATLTVLTGPLQLAVAVLLAGSLLRGHRAQPARVGPMGRLRKRPTV